MFIAAINPYLGIFVCGQRPKTKELLELLLLITFWFNSSFEKIEIFLAYLGIEHLTF